MTATQTKDGFEFACDCCGSVWTPPKLGRGSESRDFGECLELAKDDGYRAVRVLSRTGKDEWEHRCEECWNDR